MNSECEPREYLVSSVIDGDTFRIAEGWERRGRKGNVVRPTGYDTPERGQKGFKETKKRLQDLILGKKVLITREVTIDKYGRLLADVEFEGKLLAEYFPEYTKRRKILAFFLKILHIQK